MVFFCQNVDVIDSLMNLNQQKPPRPWPLIILFIIISISVLIVGGFYYNVTRKSSLAKKQEELATITYLKIRQITQWRIERLSDGQFFRDNFLMVGKIAEYIKNPDKYAVQTDILRFMKSLTTSFDYTTALILDQNGKPIMAYPDQDTSVAVNVKLKLPGIIQHRKVLFSDIYRTEKDDQICLDLLIPLINQSYNDTLVMGILALRIDPDKILYPLIQSWPTPSKSAETLLLRREGSEIIYINELRHQKNTELILRKPVDTKNLPAAMAVMGMKGSVNGFDYRGVPVIAAMNKIPGTDWYMVAKIDKAEITSELNKQMRMIIVVIFLFILVIGLFLGFLWRNQRARFFREKYELELARLTLIKHFEYILKFANDIIILIDEKLRIVEANDKALESYQYSREEFIGLSLHRIRAPEAISQFQQQLDAVRDNESATFETIHMRKDRSTFPVEVSSRGIIIEGAYYYQTIARDITDRKKAEETLKESEDKFRKIFEDSPFSMAMAGKDFMIVSANSSFCKLIGYDEDELKSFTFRNLTHPDFIKDSEVSLLRLVSREIPSYHIEKKYICKDNKEIWGSTTLSTITNLHGEILHFLVMIEDITERKRVAEELLIAKEKAEESDRLKTSFLHNVSHEIRTPMNAIIGFASLLSESDVSEGERHQYCDIISQSSNQLLSIINDIVDIANVESGQVKVNLKVFNINLTLRNLIEQYQYIRKTENNIPVLIKAGLSDDESQIRTDDVKLIQIISNLVNNALKFTRSGEIVVSYNLNNRFLEFSVRDTGIGIPSNHIEKIFKRFYQVEGAVSRQYGGTGLGLSICKAYVELLGGEISVQSEQGKGSLFTFTIPYLPA